MSLENGKCPCCNGALSLDNSKEKAICKYCGHEIIIQQAVQKCVVDGIATFDNILLAAQQAVEYDYDYDLARKKYKEALNLSPNDYRVLWGLYLCEIATLQVYLRGKGYVAMEGDLMQYVSEATQKYGERAKSFAPDDVQPYYYQLINENNAYFQNQTQNVKKKSGCYIATCVYGSYTCPQVWTLRRYRDNCLSKHWFGRLFIHTYYLISPAVVKILGRFNWFTNLCRRKLDKMVKNLNDKGVANSPYNDVDWK